jgi:acyl transferase domain-containing protein
VAVDWRAFYDGERRRRISLPTYPFQRQRYWIEPRKPQIESTVVAAAASETTAREDSASEGFGRHERPDLGVEYMPPRTSQETALAEIWQDLLGVSSIGVHDNFFDLGGHSLLATQILTRLKQDFGAALELNALFEHQTIEALAAAWAAQAPGGEDAALAQLLDRLEDMSEEEAATLLAEQRNRR